MNILDRRTWLLLAKTTCRVFMLLLLATLANAASAYAQQVPPPGMTVACSPSLLYVNAAATCNVHVAGGATGTIQILANGFSQGTLPLDSSGNLTISTALFSPNPGYYYLEEIYSGNSQYSSIAATVGLTVYSGQPMVTAETLSCSPFALYAGNSANCTINIPGGATGTVAFSIDGTAWQTPTVDTNGNAVATGGFANLAVGRHVVQAVYSGDQNFAGFTTTTVENVLSTKPLPSTISVGCTPAPVAVGASGSCQVQVGGGATGSVALSLNGQQLGSSVTLNAGSAVVPNLFSTLAAGTYGVTAFYSGDNNFATASAGTNITIANGDSTPAMSVVCSPAAPTLGQPTSCTAQLNPGATGIVAFQVDGTSWTSASISSTGAAATGSGLQNLAAGNHTISAGYAGDQNFAQASSTVNLTITSQPTIETAVNLNCSPATVATPNPTTCTVTLGLGATGAVVLYVDGVPSDATGVNSSGVGTFQDLLGNAAPGNHQLVADYSGDQNFLGGASSGVGTTTVQVLSQPGAPTVQAAVNPTSIQNGGQVSLSTSVAPGATGTVTVSAGTVQLAQLTLDSTGSASSLIDFTGASGNGAYPLTFSYSGDANFAPASGQATLTVSSQGAPNPTPLPSAPAAGTVLYSYSIAQPGGSGSGYDASGNIIAFTDSINGQWSAGYDTLNRLTAAAQAPTSTTAQNIPSQNFCWVYDSFANRTLQARAGSSFTQCSTTAVTGENYVSASYNNSNQLTALSGEAYAQGGSGSWPVSPDASGNTTQDAVNTYNYDGEGRLCAVHNTNYGAYVGYLYDAEGNRVAKGTISPPSGTDPCDMTTNNFQMTNEYVPGPDGQQLSEFDGNGNLIHTNAFAGGQLVATYANDNQGVHFQFGDWLGTRRLQTDPLGNPQLSCSGGSFGDEQNCVDLQSTAADDTELHFTQKERDAESGGGNPNTGNDNFDARYYASTVGRFISPDYSDESDPVPYADFSNPQSLNLYSYVANNPWGNVDQNGHVCGDLTTVSTYDPQGNLISFNVTDESPCLQSVLPPGSTTNASQPMRPPTSGSMSQAPSNQMGLQNGVYTLHVQVSTPCTCDTPIQLPSLPSLPAIPWNWLVFPDLTSVFTKGGTQNVLPSWAEGQRPLPGESASGFAKRLCDQKYGPGNYPTGPGSEYNKILKWARYKFGI